MQKIKLLALDLDGTLLDNNHKIPQSTLECLQKANDHGVMIVLASARPVCSMRESYQQLCLFENLMIALCGACITKGVNQETVFSATFSQEVLPEIQEIFPKNYIKVYGRDHFYINQITQETKRFSKDYRISYTVIPEMKKDCMTEPLYRIFIPDILQEKRQQKLNDLKKISGISATLLESGIEILPQGIDKGKAVRWVAEHCGISREQVMAIGNEGSDIPMLQWAGTGIAVENASEAARFAADDITTSYLELGVETAIKKYGLI